MKKGNEIKAEEFLCRNIFQASADDTVEKLRSVIAGDVLVIVVSEKNKLLGYVLNSDLAKSTTGYNMRLREMVRQNYRLLNTDVLQRDISELWQGYSEELIIVTGTKQDIKGIFYWPALLRELAERLMITKGSLETLLKNVNDAVCIIKSDNVVTSWNHQAEKIYNIKKEDIIGHDITEFFSNLMVTQVIREYKEVRSMYHQPREDKHVMISADSIKIGDRVVGAISVERDITEVVILNERLTNTNNQVQELKNELSRIACASNPFQYIKGQHYKLQESINIARKVAATNAVVLIRGESGTGKELFAKAIHEASLRVKKPFIVVNCAAIPETLFESELFGYEGGAFTGANKQGKTGVFESADGGTLFLDEVAELPIEQQAKILRFLQNQIFYRVGGSVPVNVNVRIITATNRDLEEMMRRGQFREDLYYRLNVVMLDIPPLRERREDIPELTYLFIQEFSQLYGKNILRLEPEVMSNFLEYNWPGNVREIKNVIERMVILTEGSILTKEYLPPLLKTRDKGSTSLCLPMLTEESERDLIEKTLRQTKDNRSLTARILGIPRSTLYYKIKKLGITMKL